MLLASCSQTLLDCPSSSHVSPKNVQSRSWRCAKILLFDPTPGLLRVPSSRPSPQTIEDDPIHVLKNSLAHHVPMIIGPTPYFGVEFVNQIGGRPANRSFDRFSDARQEGLDVFLGRLNEQFPVRVDAHVLSEEIKTCLHVRDDRLRRREFQPSFLQEPLDERLDLGFQ